MCGSADFDFDDAGKAVAVLVVAGIGDANRSGIAVLRHEGDVSEKVAVILV